MWEFSFGEAVIVWIEAVLLEGVALEKLMGHTMTENPWLILGPSEAPRGIQGGHNAAGVGA